MAGDTNRLNLSPITNLSANLKQEVKVFTRLNPPAILDPIITTLGKWYQSPVSKPPIKPNTDSGKPSDHLVIIMQPLASTLQIPPRQYTVVETRPLTQSGIVQFAKWVETYSWSEIYQCEDANNMVNMFQDVLLANYERCFPTKTIKVCSEDTPWASEKLKRMHRSMQREFLKHQESQKWTELNKEYKGKMLSDKQRYFDNMVSDLKTSNPGKWYSKVKRMSGQTDTKQQNILVEELIGLSDQQQAERIAEHYSAISNEYDPVKNEDFGEYFNPIRHSISAPTIEPLKVHQTIQKMNMKQLLFPMTFPFN